MKTISVLILFSVLSFAQGNDKDLIFIYHYPNSQDSLLLTGYKISETQLHIYATDFYVINCNSKDTIIFFDALQNCIIQKKVSPLSIIETKYLPDPTSQKWGDRSYLKYRFSLGSDNKIKIDTTVMLTTHIFTISDGLKILKEYDEIKNNSKSISEEFIYYILYMALYKDSSATNILFNMPKELKLDGSLSEINSDAINIYKTYFKLK